jgi:3-oxoacyl-ACP reductase-like protein
MEQTSAQYQITSKGKINANIHHHLGHCCMNWNQTQALVTGGTRGIGCVLVRLLLEKGATVTSTGLTAVSFD